MAGAEIGAVLPNAGPGVLLPVVAESARMAADPGFGVLWATGHLLVSVDTAGSYGQVTEP